MMTPAILPDSKLPQLGTNIFSQMSALAQQHQAINLSQGFPDFSGPDYLQQRLSYHIQQGANQYAPLAGVPQLCQAISDKTARFYHYRPEANSEITVTNGATEGLFASITALVRPGDEVILFEPCYDSYAPAIQLAGGICRRVSLTPPMFRPDWQAFSQLLNEKTRLVIINTPHNPSATVWPQQDIESLWQAIQHHSIYVLSDEVYEHINFSQQGHYSVLMHPRLRERAIVVSSFGKTYHMTGWKVGYCIAPPAITQEIRKIHQYLTFCVHTPSQLALADTLQALPEHALELPEFYRQRRDFLINALAESRFKIHPCEGTYFLLLDYSAISTEDDVSFCQWLTTEVGVAAIPLSVFCDNPFPHRLIRLCFAKQPDTLAKAAERLCRI